MRIAVIENRLKDYIINIFKQHPNLEIELASFLDWKPQQERYCEIPIGKIEDLDNGQYDIVIIAIKENRYLSRLLTYLHKKRIQNVYVVRLFTLDMQEDFLSETRPMNLDDTRVDHMPSENEKPYFVHLETHVCDHCNLNCKACNNFSPFVKKPSYADINQFERDLKHLTELFSGIGRFFLLGGEPLLAPELCCDMIRCFRKYFPKNELRVLTNATLVLSMKDAFWNCIRENDVIIHISLYPPVRASINGIKEKLEKEKVRYLIFKEVETFAKHWTAYPFEDEKYNNERCGSAGCHYLRNGEISKCPDAILVEFMADRNIQFSGLQSNDRVNLTEDIDAWELIEKVDSPIDMCKTCAYKRIKRTKWERVEGEAQWSDWLLPHRYEEEVKSLTCENKKANDKIVQLNGNVKGLICENKKANDEIVQLNDKAKSLTCDNKRANNEIVQLNGRVEVLNDKVKSLTCDNRKANNEIKRLESEIKASKESIIVHRRDEEELRREVCAWKEYYNDAHNSFRKVQQDYDRINNSYSYKIGRIITWLPRKIRHKVEKNRGILPKIGGSGIFKICRLFIIDILRGYKIYKNILLKYCSESVRKIYYMDYSGSGDTYLSCSYLSSIGEINGNDIFIAPSRLAAKIAGYYNFKKVETIDGTNAFSVRKMERFYQGKIYWHSLLYESEPLIYSGIMRYMQGYKGFDFMTLLKIGYEVNLGVVYTEKMWKQYLICSDDISLIFEEKKLSKGNTVLLAPYVGMNNLFGITFEFYCNLAQRLKTLGFVVCTNSNNTYEDQAIPDTIPVFLPHEQMIRFCEDAGYFIGTRSGLCDIISSAQLKKKIIIYPKQKIDQGVGDWIGFFSLKKMGLCDDAIEYNYDKEEEQQLIKVIVDSFIENYRKRY